MMELVSVIIVALVVQQAVEAIKKAIKIKKYVKKRFIKN